MSEKWQWPTLFKKATTGKIQQWTVSVEGSTVRTEYGEVGGKLQTTSDNIRSGKNIGRANETTPQKQAALKAQQLFDKKVKERYVESAEAASNKETSVQGVEPMLAFPIEKKEKHVVWPALAQPKLDGIRCLAVIEGGKASLFSRTGKPITTLPHIVEELERAFPDAGGVLDGELYNHDLKDDFNRISSVIKRDEVHPEHRVIQYHVYDTADGGGYEARMGEIEIIIKRSGVSSIKIVDWKRIDNHDQLMEYFGDCLQNGYEGAMYRHPSMPYEHKRSVALLKVKEMLDDEFEIVGVEEGNGKLQGRAGAVWCVTKDGKRFKAKMKGTLESLADYLVNFERYRGKMLTVQYQNLTPDGVPRFPVGVRVREEE
jgi:DNA ligase-1